jgi:uncharacterized MAPEG superfamily protein
MALKSASKRNNPIAIKTMSTAIVCVILAGFLPLIAAGIAKFGPQENNPSEPFDNHQPRAWLAKQTGMRARANAAQANTFESLPFFYIAIAIAFLFDAPQERINMLAIIFLLARVAYLICYLKDWANVRSLMWLIGFGCTVALFFQIP